jgi:hypothetical protein
MECVPSPKREKEGEMEMKGKGGGEVGMRTVYGVACLRQCIPCSLRVMLWLSVHGWVGYIALGQWLMSLFITLHNSSASLHLSPKNIIVGTDGYWLIAHGLRIARIFIDYHMEEHFLIMVTDVLECTTFF